MVVRGTSTSASTRLRARAWTLAGCVGLLPCWRGNQSPYSRRHGAVGSDRSTQPARGLQTSESVSPSRPRQRKTPRTKGFGGAAQGSRTSDLRITRSIGRGWWASPALDHRPQTTPGAPPGPAVWLQLWLHATRLGVCASSPPSASEVALTLHMPPPTSDGPDRTRLPPVSRAAGPRPSVSRHTLGAH